MLEEKLFARAIELPAKARDAFLRDACGEDEALRRSVNALLVAHEVESTVIDQPCEESADVSLILEEELFDRVSGADSDSSFIKIEEGKAVHFGDYALKQEIARGAMGVVYRAEQISLKRIVAVKMIRPDFLIGSGAVNRFQAEAEAAAGLDHPNIVPIYEIGEYEGRHYFSMKLIGGSTLADHKDRLRKAPQAAAKLMALVARAIHSAHQRGILHRDIKPGNILVDEDNIPYVTDFGLAKPIEGGSKDSRVKFAGTPYYMGPEQVRGDIHSLTTAVDVYSLGAVLYELLTGVPPHKGESLAATLRLVINERPKAPRSLNPGIDRDIESIILQCLEKNPNKRYASAVGLANDLESWLRGEPVTARPIRNDEKILKWIKRNPLPALLLSIVVVVLLILSIGGPTMALRQTELKKWADNEHTLADLAAQREQEARMIAEERAEELRRTLYASEMNLAAEMAREPNGTRPLRELLGHWKPEPGEEDLRGWEWYYLETKAHQELRDLATSQELVDEVDWSPDGSLLALAGRGRGVQILDSLSGTETLILEGHLDEACTVEWSPDGTRVAGGGIDGTVHIWDARSGEVLLSLPLHEGRMTSVSWSPDGTRLASTGDDWVIRIVDATNGRELIAFQGHEDLPNQEGTYTALAWSPDSLMLASANEDQQVKVWDANSGNRIWESDEYGPVRSLAWSPDGRLIAAESSAAAIVIRDASSGEELRRLAGHTEVVAGLAWSPDSRWLASASWDHSVRIWDVEQGECHRTFRTAEACNSVSWSRNARHLACGISTGIIVFDADREETPTLRGHRSTVNSVGWSPDGRQLASSSYDLEMRIWAMDGSRQSRSLSVDSGGTKDADWSPDGTHVASVGMDGLVWVSDADAGKPAIALDGLNDQVHSVRWSPDGERIAAVAGRSTLGIWEFKSSRLLATLDVSRESDGHDLTCLAWSPDGRYLASPNHEGVILIWDADTYSLLRTLDCHSGISRRIVWSPDGDRVAVAMDTGVIQIIESEKDGRSLTLMGHNSRADGLDWSPDGRRLATGGVDCSIRIWNPLSGQLCLKLLGHEHGVTSVAWSPDGSRLASGSWDKTIRVWDTVVNRPGKTE